VGLGEFVGGAHAVERIHALGSPDETRVGSRGAEALVVDGSEDVAGGE